jgi:hypothetical protein
MSPKCTVCRHQQRHEIDLELLAGATLASLAARYGLSTSALSRHHQHLKPRLQEAKQLLEQQRWQEYLVTLASLSKLLLVSAETALNNEDYPLLIKLSQQIGNNFKLIRTLPVQTPDLSCYHLLTSEDWPVHGTVISDNEVFYEEERRLIARNFSRPCDELEPSAASLNQAAFSSSAPAADRQAHLSQKAPAAEPTAAAAASPASTGPTAQPGASGMQVGRNRDVSGMQPGPKREKSGLEPGPKRPAGAPQDRQEADFPGLLPEILNLLRPLGFLRPAADKSASPAAGPNKLWNSEALTVLTAGSRNGSPLQPTDALTGG